MNEDLKKRLYPGMRTIKTAISIVVCLFIYYSAENFGIADRSDALLACIAAILCMQDSIKKSVKNGLNRLFGTALGALTGLLLSLIGLTYDDFFINTLTIVIGIVLLIVLCDVLNLRDSIPIACVVLLVIALQHTDDTILEHGVRRFVDTGIGIFVSVLINRFISKPKKSDL